jgi:hypothetical protein
MNSNDYFTAIRRSYAITGNNYLWGLFRMDSLIERCKDLYETDKDL